MDDQKKSTENGKSEKPKMNPLQNSGETLYGWRVNGGPKRDLQENIAHIKSLIDLDIRDDDVLLATYMKSGQIYFLISIYKYA